MPFNIKIIATAAVPRSKRVNPDNAEVYKAIGRLMDGQSIEITDSADSIKRLENSVAATYSGKNSIKRFGFTVSVTKSLNAPQIGFTTIYFTKKKTDEE